MDGEEHLRASTVYLDQSWNTYRWSRWNAELLRSHSSSINVHILSWIVPALFRIISSRLSFGLVYTISLIIGVLVTGSYVSTPLQRPHKHLVFELKIVSKHGFSTHRRIGRDVALHHAMRHRPLHILDQPKHIVVGGSRKGHLSGEELAERAAHRPHVDGAIYRSSFECSATVFQS